MRLERFRTSRNCDLTMQIFKILLISAVFSFAGISAFSAETADTNVVAVGHEAVATAHGEHEEAHGLPLYAVPLFHIGKFQVTNSMVVTWIVASVLDYLCSVCHAQYEGCSEGAQNFWEWLVESLYSFLEGIIGHDLVRKTFWFFATIFIFILFCNWFGLIPGVGTIGMG